MKEQELFDHLKTSYLYDLELAEDKFSKWDCVSHKFKFLIELKCRRKHYDTLLIEKIKYDSLTRRAAKMGYKPLYINHTPQGIYSFRLADITLNWETNTKNPATTAFANKLRIEKTVAYLPISDAKKIT